MPKQFTPFRLMSEKQQHVLGILQNFYDKTAPESQNNFLNVALTCWINKKSECWGNETQPTLLSKALGLETTFPTRPIKAYITSPHLLTSEINLHDQGRLRVWGEVTRTRDAFTKSYIMRGKKPSDSQLKNIKISDYIGSEKLDGIRAMWTGQVLVSKGGLVFYFVPSWFLELLPSGVILDGEMWGGRGTEKGIAALGATKKPYKTTPPWSEDNDIILDRDFTKLWVERNVRYKVFDILNFPQIPAEDRLEILKKLIRQRCLCWASIKEKWEKILNTPLPKQCPLQDLEFFPGEELYQKLTSIIEDDGEGVMMRHKGSAFVPGISGTKLLKFKKINQSEAVLIGMNPSVLQRGWMGSVIGAVVDRGGNLFIKNGKPIIVNAGSGLTDNQKRNYKTELIPKLGQVFNFQFFEFDEKHDSYRDPRFTGFNETDAWKLIAREIAERYDLVAETLYKNKLIESPTRDLAVKFVKEQQGDAELSDIGTRFTGWTSFAQFYDAVLTDFDTMLALMEIFETSGRNFKVRAYNNFISEIEQWKAENVNPLSLPSKKGELFKKFQEILTTGTFCYSTPINFRGHTFNTNEICIGGGFSGVPAGEIVYKPGVGIQDIQQAPRELIALHSLVKAWNEFSRYKAQGLLDGVGPAAMRQLILDLEVANLADLSSKLQTNPAEFTQKIKNKKARASLMNLATAVATRTSTQSAKLPRALLGEVNNHFREVMTALRANTTQGFVFNIVGGFRRNKPESKDIDFLIISESKSDLETIFRTLQMNMSVGLSLPSGILRAREFVVTPNFERLVSGISNQTGAETYMRVVLEGTYRGNDVLVPVDFFFVNNALEFANFALLGRSSGQEPGARTSDLRAIVKKMGYSLNDLGIWLNGNRVDLGDDVNGEEDIIEKLIQLDRTAKQEKALRILLDSTKKLEPPDETY